MDLILQIYLWCLILVSFITGMLMITLVNHQKRQKENREATEKWLNLVQHCYWGFFIVMGIIGLIIIVALFDLWI